jgi:hypothetical protein
VISSPPRIRQEDEVHDERERAGPATVIKGARDGVCTVKQAAKKPGMSARWVKHPKNAVREQGGHSRKRREASGKQYERSGTKKTAVPGLKKLTANPTNENENDMQRFVRFVTVHNSG